MGKLVVVVGGQYGSEAKGAVVTHLTRTDKTYQGLATIHPPLVIRVGGPNAGHTTYDDEGTRWPLRQVPVGVVRPDALLAIGAGSLIDLKVLRSEIFDLESAGHEVHERLYIDPMATILTEADHAHEENSGIQDRIGSTSKGIGIARANRIMRTAPVVRDMNPPLGAILEEGIRTPVAELATHHLRNGGTVILEGTQGFALGLHRQFYPFATSADCTAIDVLAQAQLSPWAPEVTEFEVWVVFRSYPIRVAGHSGPLWDETSWDALGQRSGGYIKPEKTTVTQKVRRVGEWDHALARQALWANGGPTNPIVHVAFMMADYLDPQVAGQTNETDLLHSLLFEKERALDVTFELVGTGPQSIVDRRG